MLSRHKRPKPTCRSVPQSPRQLDTTFIKIIGPHLKPYPIVIVDVGLIRVNGVVRWLLAGVKAGVSAGVPGPLTIRMTHVAMTVELEYYSVWIRIPDAEVVGVRETRLPVSDSGVLKSGAKAARRGHSDLLH